MIILTGAVTIIMSPITTADFTTAITQSIDGYQSNGYQNQGHQNGQNAFQPKMMLGWMSQGA